MSRMVDTIIVHCSDTKDGHPCHAGTIDDWHKSRGFHRNIAAREAFNPKLEAIGYHYVIQPDGRVETGRAPDEVGAHAKGHNANSLGICMAGRGQFTPAAWKALGGLLEEINRELPGVRLERPLRIAGHNEFDAAKTCPGFNVLGWLMDGHHVEKDHTLGGDDPGENTNLEPSAPIRRGLKRLFGGGGR